MTLNLQNTQNVKRLTVLRKRYNIYYTDILIIVMKCTQDNLYVFQVNGLTVAGRESYLSLLTDALRNNLDNLKGIDEPDNQLSRRDVEQCAIELEYEAFSSSTVISLYRRAMTKLVICYLQIFSM